MTKILFTNVHNENVGDTAIFWGAIDALKIAIHDAEFTVLAMDPNQQTQRKNVKLMRGILDNIEIAEMLKRMDNRFLKKTTFILLPFQALLLNLQCVMWALFQRRGKDVKLFLNSEKLRVLREFARADIVIEVGGGYLNDKGGGGFIHGILIYLLPIYLSKILRKPYMLYAVSFGPFHKTTLNKPMTWTNLLLKYSYNKIDLITLREEYSREHLIEMGITKPPIYVTADAAFFARPEKTDKIKEIMTREGLSKNGSPLVGITVVNYPFPASYNPQELRKRYKEVMTQVCDYLVSELGATLVFASHNEIVIQDSEVIQEIVNSMRFKKKVKILSEPYLPDIMKGIYGEMDFMICYRLHSKILASMMCTPGVVIAHHHKTTGIMKTLGLERFVVDINDSYDKIILVINEAWSMRDKIKRHLKHRRNILHDLDMLNAEFALALLNFSKTKAYKIKPFSSKLSQEEIDSLYDQDSL